MSIQVVRVCLLGSLLMVGACSSSPGSKTPAAAPTLEASSTNSSAAVAAKAAEPRTGDPTAARPPTRTTETTPDPATGSKFGTVGMTGAAPEPSSPSSSSSKATPPKIGARHVLIQWMGAQHANNSVVRSKEQAFTLAKEVLRRARAKDDFARLAVEYSDEPNAGQRGGSLGRFGHGAMVPEFEAAAFKLDVGEISDVVESPFGFHVILRTE